MARHNTLLLFSIAGLITLSAQHATAVGASGLSCDAVDDIIIAVVGNQGFQTIDNLCLQHGLGNLKDMSEADFAPLGERHAACRSQGQSRFSFNSRESFATYLPRLAAYAQQAKDVALRAGVKDDFEQRFSTRIAPLETAIRQPGTMPLQQMMAAQHELEQLVETAREAGVDYFKISEFEHRLAATRKGIHQLLQSDVNTQVAQQLQQGIARLEQGMTVADIGAVKTDMETIQKELSELSAINIELEQEAGQLWAELQRTARASIDKVCHDASRNLCSQMLPDFSPELRDYFVVIRSGLPENNPTIFDFACTAKNKGMLKSFNTGGLFSSEISMELSTGTYYFEKRRLDMQTMQFVDDSFKGPTAVNVLEAVAFQPVSGPRRKITQSGKELEVQMGLWGWIPKVDECR